jgi:bifunctional non-homologous end joining protein LigD
VAPRRTHSGSVIEIAGRELRVSNLDKVLYPATGFTKAEVIDYYARIGPVILPHLAGRAVTLVRFPDGVEGKSFFEKNCPSHAPDWVRTAPFPEATYCVLDDLPALVWVANLAALELHTLQATADDPDRPTSMVFDLDPGPGAGVLDCCRVALELREVLDGLGLAAVVKTSGSKGLHLAVPLHTKVTADETKAFSRAAGQLLAKRDPRRVTVVMKRELRKGKVFVDWSQNDRHKTTVGAYSLRAKARPTVSTPIGWDEVDAALAEADADLLTFEAADVLARIEEHGDLFADNLTLKQSLPDLAGATPVP